MAVGETRTSYHHGALREELLSACVALIDSEGIGAVSLRRVAREAGVSPGAPYHHFADRSALLMAISVQGYELLGQRLQAARAQAPTALRSLSELIKAYVEFAREHPAYLQVMLRPELSRPEDHPQEAMAGEAALGVLTETVEECQREGTAPPGPSGPLAAMIWALATGIVALWLDGPLEARCESLGTTPEILVTQITALLEQLLAGHTGTRAPDWL